MMKNKGFTLIELLAALAILGVIVTLSTFSYITISKNVKKNQCEAKVLFIEKAAVKYASDTNIMHGVNLKLITMDNLKNNGYLTDEEIINPVTNESFSMNVNLSKTNSLITADYLGDCNG